jgi:hypothetical protein
VGRAPAREEAEGRSVTFYDVVTYGGLLLIGVMLGRYGRGEWAVLKMNARRWREQWAEHRAAKRRDDGLDIIWPPVKNAPRSRRRPLRYRDPRDSPTVELATLNQLAWDEAEERLADAHLLPPFRQEQRH